ncbi:hypothetical protein HHI36_012786 [Cryptolaemus montrouzieri]|uniref:Uncharacterized protein n=1 Tax=Cryptolaemus montrouzieri TaxID=559131 RepID=A0ABD2NF92_9CUCU
MDKCPVLMINTDQSHTAELFPTGRRNKHGEVISKPQCAMDYKARKGVDLTDQISSHHTLFPTLRCEAPALTPSGKNALTLLKNLTELGVRRGRFARATTMIVELMGCPEEKLI